MLENKLKLLDLDNIDNVRGQGYDNGSDMKGKHHGVQRRVLNVNPRAIYSTCGCHSLNLTLVIWSRLVVEQRTFLESSNASIQFFPILLRNGIF